MLIEHYFSGGSRKFERGGQRGNLNGRGFTTPINYDVGVGADTYEYTRVVVGGRRI